MKARRVFFVYVCVRNSYHVFYVNVIVICQTPTDPIYLAKCVIKIYLPLIMRSVYHTNRNNESIKTLKIAMTILSLL